MIQTMTNLASHAYTNLDEKAALRAFEAIRRLADGTVHNGQGQKAAESAKLQLATMLGLFPAVTIQAEAGTNPEALGKVKQALVDAGYQVPSIETGGTAKGKDVRLLYFTVGDQVDAEYVASILRQYLGGVTAVLSTSTTPMRPRQYQLQLGREAFTASPETPKPTE
jgi:hypothetical protein